MELLDTDILIDVQRGVRSAVEPNAIGESVQRTAFCGGGAIFKRRLLRLSQM